MNFTCLEKGPSDAAFIALSSGFALSGLAAVFGNTVVLWLFYKSKSLRTVSNRFLVSLSVADLLVGAVVEPIFLVEYLTPSVDNQNVIHFFWIHSTAATTWNLCCVSVDRFVAIRFPLSYQVILTKKRCCVVITVIWVISLFLPFTIMFVKNEATDHHAELWLSFAFILFVFPIIVVFFCYICIFKTANKQYKRVKKDYQHGDDSSRRALNNFKAIKTVGLVLGVFIVTWMPSLILALVTYYYRKTEHEQCEEQELHSVALPWAEAAAFTSSAINPLIYYFRNGEFCQAFRNTFNFDRLHGVHYKNAPDPGVKQEQTRIDEGVGILRKFPSNERQP